jgi:hypothetical protein
MQPRQRIRTRLSVKRVLIASAGALCFLLAIGFIVFINLSDNREVIAAANGDYRTKASGDWSSISTWEKYNGSGWINATVAPTSADGMIEIISGHSVTITSSVIADQVVIDDGGMLTNSGGTFTIVNGIGTDIIVNGLWNIDSPVTISNDATGVISGLTFCDNGGALTVGSGTAFITINNFGLFENDGGTITTTSGSWVVNDGGSYRHNQDGGTIPLAAWTAGSNCEITGSVFSAPANLNQSFSNFAWSCASQAANLNLNGALKTINGDFRMTSTGKGSVKLSTSTNDETLSIGGNYYHDGGKIYITETGNWNTNVAGNFNLTDGEIIMVGGIAGADGNPTISVAGNSTVTGGTINMSQYTGPATGKGIGTITLYGDLTFNGGTITSTSSGNGYGVFNFSKTGTQSITCYTPFGTKVDFNVTTGATLNLGNNILSGGRHFTLADGAGLVLGDSNGITSSGTSGNIQVTGTRNFNTAANYTYNGSSAQVTGNALPSTVKNLTVINPFDLSLSKSVTVNSTLTMTSGNIYTTPNILCLGFNDSNVGTLVRSTATISGWFKRWITKDSPSDYIFPISYCSNYRGVNLHYTNAPTTGGYITVHYTPTDPGTFGLPLNDAGATISDVGHEGYWNITAESSLTNGSFGIDINADSYTGITDHTKLHIVRRITSEGAWALVGTHAASTGSKDYPVTHRLLINGPSFGEFAIAGGRFNPIPIQLLKFDARPEGKIVKLSWITSNEINNDYFTAERAEDGINFIPLTTVDGAGNSTSTISYKSTDVNPFAGMNYYRLKQTDYEGNFSYSDIRKVRFDLSLSDAAIVLESFIPNPFMDDFTLNYSALADGPVNLMVMNCWGEVVIKETLTAVKGLNSYRFVENINLAVGIYYLTPTSDDKMVSKKIIKSS